MANSISFTLPAIEDLDGLSISRIHVDIGDTIQIDQDILSLESEKTVIDVPSQHQGTVTSVNVSVGDKVSEGDVILTLEVSEDTAPAETPKTAPQQTAPAEAAPAAASAIATSKGDADLHAQTLVLGSGPGGYTAAFRAADLGQQVIMIERHARIGGVCLNVGCIPSKALLHTAQIINEATDMGDNGVSFAEPKIDIRKIESWKNSIVDKLTGGLKALAKQRKVDIVQGEASFTGTHTIQVYTGDGIKTISFDNCIVAAGSRVTKIPVFQHDDPRMMDSTDALDLEDIPKKLLVIGGGIIGL